MNPAPFDYVRADSVDAVIAALTGGAEPSVVSDQRILRAIS